MYYEDELYDDEVECPICGWEMTPFDFCMSCGWEPNYDDWGVDEMEETE